MEQKVILKKYIKSDQLWEKAPHLACMIDCIILMILFFGGMVSLTLLDVPDVLVWLYLICLVAAAVAFIVWTNKQRNLTKSTAFIKRDNILYMVKMGYIVDYQTVVNPLDAALFGWEDCHNMAIANQVQANEKMIREARQKATLYVEGLDYYLASGNLPENITEIRTMADPSIEKETKRNIWISYEYDGARYTVKIRNVYDFSGIL